MIVGASIIILRPNLWSGYSGVIERILVEKGRTFYLIKCDRGFHAHATAEELEVL